MIENDEILQIFFSEAEELLKLAETSLMSLESTPESASDIEELFRSLHTLKSSAAMTGFTSISEYSHLLETLLERLRARKLSVTKNLITMLLESLDFVKSMVDRAVRGVAEADSEELRIHREQVSRYLGLDTMAQPPEMDSSAWTKPPVEPPKDHSYYKIRLNFRRDILDSGRDPLPVLLSLSDLGEFVQNVADVSELPSFEDLSPYDMYISWQIVLKTNRPYSDIEDVFAFVKHDNDIRIENITGRYKDGVDLKLADLKLGEVLMERGNITREALAAALSKQQKLGEILVAEGKVVPEEVREAVALQEESRAIYRKTTIRVSVEKIDNLVNLGEEMGVGLARMQALLNKMDGLGDSGIDEEMEFLLKVNREFQDRVAKVRMFPLEGTFSRFQRMVRDLAFQQDKLIKVIVTGLDTELDKEVIEHITDPLKHLVRNCVDHGIEPPGERKAKGKPAEGTIEFRAHQKEGKIFIEIQDDGRGINWEAIQRKAFEEGWIKADQDMSKNSLMTLLFRPGFSTASAVTEVSGRGIGMDVVRTHMDQLGGSMDIQTEKDQGTTFVLSLPLRFSLMEVLQVKVLDDSYLIPMQTILGTEKYEEKLVKDMGISGKLYLFRGDYVPLVNLSGVLGHGSNSDKERDHILVFVDTGRKIFGIPVAEILEPQQIIIKSLETNYRSVKSVAGAAVTADGSVSLVLDLFDLEEVYFKQAG